MQRSVSDLHQELLKETYLDQRASLGSLEVDLPISQRGNELFWSW